MGESLQEKLNRAIDAMLAFGRTATAASPDAELAPFVQVAAQLRALPGENFKAELKADLIRRATMATGAATRAGSESREQQTAIPCLCFRDAARAIEFYKQVFGVEESFRLTEQEKLGVAEIRIGNTKFLISREAPEYGAAGGTSPETLGGSTVRFKIMVADADATASRMLAAGSRVIRPVADQFYGDRAGQIADPFGYTWIVAMHKEDVSTQEMQQRLDAWTKQPSAPLEEQSLEDQNLEEKSVEEKMSSNPATSKTEVSGTEAVKPVNYIREGFRTVSPYILVGGAAKFIEFLTQAFGAEEKGRVPVPGGKIMHAEVQLGDSTIEMSDGNDQFGPSPVTIHLTVPDADAAYRRALQAGATSLYEPSMQFYGEYEGGVRDPFGNEWYITPQAKKYSHPTVQPYLHLHEAKKMIPFLEAAFGARAEGVHEWPGGAIAHATIFIGNGQIEIDEAFRANRQSPCHLHLYVPDTDAVYAQALRAGATTIEAPSDKPYGDRTAGVKDPFGNSWFIATHIKDVSF